MVTYRLWNSCVAASTRYQNQTQKKGVIHPCPTYILDPLQYQCKGPMKSMENTPWRLEVQSKVHLWSPTRSSLEDFCRIHCRFVWLFSIGSRVIHFPIVPFLLAYNFCFFRVFSCLSCFVILGVFCGLSTSSRVETRPWLWPHTLPIRSRKSICRCLRHGTYMGVSLNGVPPFPTPKWSFFR